MMRLLYRTADVLVAVADAVASDLSEITGVPKESINIIHNPVDAHEILELSREEVDIPWFSPGAPPVVISVGNLWPHKDHQTLIKAVRLARRRRPLRLILLGEGPQRPALEKLTRELNLEEDVLLPGFVENPYSWMARARVFVLPSRWEGLPTALIEAMVCGITPIATNCPGGSAEILGHGRYGILTPVGDATAMAEAILDTLDHPLGADVLTDRARAFSPKSIVDRYMRLVVNPGE